MSVTPSDQQHPIVAEMLEALDLVQREYFEERASIFQYCAKFDRDTSEMLALLEVIRLYGWPPCQK